MSDLLDVSLDYLVGKTDVQLDKEILKSILKLSKFSDEDKDHIFAVLDAFIGKKKNSKYSIKAKVFEILHQFDSFAFRVSSML
ncbi:hypothetical protein EYV94_23405 [Puteibacter caeruleilacunae]|nr:hypothetical protein EYV94_23405 [Puteibacter caeruleilacunae]